MLEHLFQWFFFFFFKR